MALFELKQDTGSGAAAPWAPPTFKDCVAADICAAFFEEDEHADRHTVDGKDVLIVEDIIDSGNTLSKVREILSLREPKSLAICTLLDKPSRREVNVPVEFIGFSIPDEFVVGYGIDYAQRYRHLPYVGKVVLLDE